MVDWRTYLWNEDCLLATHSDAKHACVNQGLWNTKERRISATREFQSEEEADRHGIGMKWHNDGQWLPLDHYG